MDADELRVSKHGFSRRAVLGTAAAGVAGVLAVSSSASAGTTFVAENDGNWSDPSTWESDTVPTEGSDVSIPSGITVTVASRVQTWYKLITVEGTLRHALDTDSLLRVETIVTKPGSRYEIGTASTPVQQDTTVEVEIIDDGPIDEDKWPHRKNKGFMLMGDVEIVGAEKTTWTTLSQPAEAGDTTIELTSEPTNWNPGDEIVVPGLEPYSSEALDHDDERREVSAVDGSTVTLDAALDHDHVPPKSGLDAYVLNLTRNIEFFSENTAEHRRGHLMIMSLESDVRYVRFTEMGRTNKDEPLTNPVRNADQVDADDPNPAARYPFHYHRTGMDAKSHYAEGLAVDGSPGWGIVNHHANADIVDSVTYNVFGSGFVAEGGNERGSFKRNIAVRSHGSGETIDSRSAGAHGGDPPIDDFGHAGHGFWLQSPLVEVVDNVAVGHRHQGFVWWLRSLLDKPEETLAEESCAGGDIEDSRVTYCPNTPMKYVPDDWPILEAIEQQRFSSDSMDELMWDTQKIPSTFAPLATVSGNTTAGAAGGLDFSRHNFKWKHERFSDFNVIDDMTVYNIGRFYDEDGEVHEPGPPRHLSSGHQGRGGNVGASFRYTSNVTLRNSHLIGSGLDNSFAVPFHDYRWNNTIENCTIEGWDWGVVSGEHNLTWVRNNVFKNNTYDVNWHFDNVGPAMLEGNDVELLRNDFEKRNQKASEVLDTSQGAGLVVDGRTVYVEESAPDYVPFPDEDSLDGLNNIESMDQVDDETDLVGLTNAEMQDQFGISIGGAVMPDDAVSESWIDGAKLGPATRSPPKSLYLNAANADTLGGFEIVSEPDAAHGQALRSAGTDDPASISFDCDAGTYEINARVWPDAWNGDEVDFRVDGGEWKTAEKIKDPASFRWHSAAPNGGEAYTWDLSEGTHTLEFKSDDPDLKIDELFITSDSQTYGAYSQSAESGDTSDATEQQPYTDHDLSHIEAEDFDIGGEGVAYHDTSDGNKAGAYRDTDVDIEETSDDGSGYNIGWIEDGEWWEYTVDVPADGDYTLVARLAGKNDTTLDVAVDGSTVATVDVPNTGGWQEWTTVEYGTVSLTAGTHVIRVTANGDDFNFNWFGFTDSDTTAPDAPTNLSTSNVTDSSVDLSWDAPSDSGTGVDHYNVYVDTVKHSEATDTSTTVSGLSPDTTYDFYVTAVDGEGNESDPSNTVTATTEAETKTVTVTGNGAANYNDGSDVRYIIETTGTVESGGTGDLESFDRVGGSVASGKVPADGSDTDTYSLVSGKITDVSTWGGDVTVTVDGTTWSG